MIQRIQTLYLLLVVILSAITLFMPAAGLQNVQTGVVYELSYRGLHQLTETGTVFITGAWMLTALAAIIPLFTFVIIWMFKKRLLQIRLVIFDIVLMAGYYGLLFIYLWQYGKILEASMYFEVIAAFPLICIILSILAIRAIGKDEALIKSLNRIR